MPKPDTHRLDWLRRGREINACSFFTRELAKDGFSIKIADLDAQQTTCADWVADHGEVSYHPEIQVQPFDNLKTALKDTERFDVYILDGGRWGPSALFAETL